MKTIEHQPFTNTQIPSQFHVIHHDTFPAIINNAQPPITAPMSRDSPQTSDSRPFFGAKNQSPLTAAAQTASLQNSADEIEIDQQQEQQQFLGSSAAAAPPQFQPSSSSPEANDHHCDDSDGVATSKKSSSPNNNHKKKKKKSHHSQQQQRDQQHDHQHDHHWDLNLLWSDIYLASNQFNESALLINKVLIASHGQYYKALYKASLFYLHSNHDEMKSKQFCRLAIRSVCDCLDSVHGDIQSMSSKDKHILSEQQEESENDDHHLNEQQQGEKQGKQQATDHKLLKNDCIHVSLRLLEYWSLVLFGYSCELEKNLKAAMSFYQKAIDHCKNHRLNAMVAYYHMGVAMYEYDRHYDAIHMFKMAKSVCNHPKDIKILHEYWDSLCLFKIGRCFHKLNELDRALSSYGRAITLFPSLYVVYLHRRDVFSVMNRYEEAEKDLECLLRHVKNMDLIMTLLTEQADSEYSMGYYDRAHKSYIDLMRRFPHYYYPYTAIAYHFFHNNQTHEALGVLDHGMKRVGSDHEGIKQLVSCKIDLLLQLGDERYQTQLTRYLCIQKSIHQGVLARGD